MVTQRPSITPSEAEALTQEWYGLAVAAQELPSERDRNFRLNVGDNEQCVLKVASTGERREWLVFENEVLDGLAARLAATRIGKPGLKALESHLKKMEAAMKSGNAHSWFINHHAFHEEIFRISGNSRILGLSANVRLSVQRFHQLLLTVPNRLEIAFAEHKEIYNAIRLGDAVQAEASARRHIANAREIVVGVMEEQAAQGG